MKIHNTLSEPFHTQLDVNIYSSKSTDYRCLKAWTENCNKCKKHTEEQEKHPPFHILPHLLLSGHSDTFSKYDKELSLFSSSSFVVNKYTHAETFLLESTSTVERRSTLTNFEKQNSFSLQYLLYAFLMVTHVFMGFS